MERNDNFAAGDRNNSNGTSLQQREASADVFEDGQNRSIDGPIRPMKDGEPYVYGDSRPDDRNDQGGFVPLDESPMTNTVREEFPEAHHEDPEFLEEHRVDQMDEIRPHYLVNDPNSGEEAILVPKVVL